MNQPGEQTIYDKVIIYLKNTRWIAILLVISAVLGGVAASTTHIKELIDFFTRDEDPSPKFSVKYYTVGGHAISLLLTGVLDPSLQKQLGGRPVVWKNSVFEELRILHNTYASQFGDGIEFSATGLSTEQVESLSKTTKLIPFSTHHSFIVSEPDTAFNLDQIGNPLEAPGWKISFIKEAPTSEITSDFNNGNVSLTRLIFSKEITCKEAAIAFEKLDHPIAPLLEKNNGNSCQDLNFQVTAQYYDDACAGEQHWLVSIDVPGLSMSTAVIENISSEPITVKNLSFGVKKLNGIGLLNHSIESPDSKNTIGDGSLRTTDRLIIPLSLRFSTEFNDPNYNPPVETYKYSEVGTDKIDTLISKYPTVNLMIMSAPPATGATDEAELAVSESNAEAESAENAAETEPQLQPTKFASMPSEYLRTRYGFTPENNQNLELPYIGTVLTPKTVEINGIEQKIHEIELGGMYISDSISGASCPYLFAANTDGRVLPLGKILVGHNRMEKDGVDSRFLPAWPSKLLLKEIDPETTYLRSAVLVCETDRGEIISSQSTNNLQPSTQKSTILKQGEEISLHFPPLPENTFCKSVFAKIGGYYIPDTQIQSIRQLSLQHYKATN